MYLGNHVLSSGLGEVLSADTGFLLSRDPDTVRAPDVAFVRQSRLQELRKETGYAAIAPDLACEVVSPSDSFARVHAKALHWLQSGARMVVVVDPEAETVHVYRGPDHIDVLSGDGLLEIGDVVPGWTLPIRRLFD